MTDKQLLQRYLETQGNEEFGAIVERYGGLVMGTAVRCTGRLALAEEVTQAVFLLLAQKAGGMREPYNLASWLHRTAVLQSANANRTEARERRKMSEFLEHSQNQVRTESQEPWSEIMPFLDRAIEALSSADRQAILLRFYEERSYRSIGEMTNRSEDACRLRVARALKKLSAFLRREGVTASVSFLGAGLGPNLAWEISPHFVSSVSQSIAAAVPTTGCSLLIPTIGFMSSVKTTAVLSLCAFLLPIGIPVDELGTSNSGSAPHSSEGAVRPMTPQSLTNAIEEQSTSSSSGSRSEREIARTIRELGAHPNPAHAEAAIGEFLLGLSYEELPRALSALPEKPGFRIGFGMGHALFTRWAEFDPVEALATAERQSKPRYQEGGREAAMAAWVAMDPSAVRRFIEGQDWGGRRTKLEDTYWGVRAGQDPRGAADEAMDLSKANGRDRRLDDILRQWRGRDATGAIEWLRGLEDDARRDRWLEAAIEQVAWADPAQAFAYTKEFYAGFHQRTILAKVFANWAFSDPAIALKQMLALPAATRAPEMVQKFAVEIPSVEMAKDLLNKIPAGDTRDHFIAGMAIGFDDWGRLSNDHGAGATIGDLIGLIEDDSVRADATRRLASGWSKRDRSSAEDWVRHSVRLADPLRENILKQEFGK